MSFTPAPLPALRAAHTAAAFLFVAGALSARPLVAQDTTQQAVRIGLTYAPGTRPGVLVLPSQSGPGDSVRAILQRDLDFGDRVTIIGAPGTAAGEAASVAGATVNYGLWKALGAAAVVQPTVTAGGVHIAVHDVAAGNVARVRDFPLPAPENSEPWRWALHGVADEIELWLTGTRGIAQTRVLYVRDGRVYVTDSDGAGDRAITTGRGALSPAWNPNGRSIAYSTFGAHGTEIMVRDLATGATREAPSTSRGLNITPAFSPDGTMLVYAHGEENGTDLYATDAAGLAPSRRITVSRGTDNVSPTFSPDGHRLAFTSGRAGHPEIYTVDADGSNAELLTSFDFGDQSYRSNPDWSPDGRLIAFQSQLAGRFQITTISLRDRSVRQLTSEGVNEDPSWAPDSRHLVFTSSRTGTKQLFVLDTETGRARQLTHAAGARLAAWSPAPAAAAP